MNFISYFKTTCNACLLALEIKMIEEQTEFVEQMLWPCPWEQMRRQPDNHTSIQPIISFLMSHMVLQMNSSYNADR